ncbi:MAG: YdiU family protein [Rubrimonas sp.]|uniref:protein adenylyltransferase SelO n=1 Tax=Rubrimonas sp. TaxID=2036015 RepID=UPI002FDE6E34
MTAPRIAFDNSYARLPDRFFARVAPEAPPAPRLLRFNRPLAEELGLDADALDGVEGAAIFSGGRPPEGAEPLAMAYAGHQFGGWVPQLGDGRALLLGEVIDRNGERRDIQLKGSGRTPFSRRGDGKAALGPALREYSVAEAMHALGVPTTRALAVALTGGQVFRESVLPGAVVTRVARGHVRVGTFQYFYARGDVAALKALADYVIARNHPEAAEAEDRALALLQAVAARTAALVAQWMAVGFIHGVMNTDNLAVSGETIDYGPCAFMDAYHPDTVFSSIDHTGRYAYANQPRIAQWNLAQLGQALLPLIAGGDEDAALPRAQAAIDAIPELYAVEWLGRFRAKLGLARAEEGDAALIADLLGRMTEGRADFTLTFRALSALGDTPGPQDAAARALFDDPAALDDWLGAWRARLTRGERPLAARQAAMRAANPALIPRNHRVEDALAAAHEGDLGPLDALCAALARPYDELAAEHAHLAAPPRPGEEVTATFCGT